MAVAPGDVEGVVAGGADGDWVDVICNTLVVQLFFAAPLVDAYCTATGPAQVCTMIAAHHTILPVNGEISFV